MSSISDKPIADNPGFRQLLAEGLDQLACGRDTDKERQLLLYLDLLLRWNKIYNLTAVVDPEEMIRRHLLDSLVIAEHLRGDRFIDIGTGAGLPGIPLAICLEDKTFALLDSNGKKTRFLIQVKAELNLENIEVIHSRVDHYQVENGYDGILSRAFSSLAEMTTLSCHLLSDGGVFYAMKGCFPEQELSALPKAYTLQATHPLCVPGGTEQRHLVELIVNQGISARPYL